MIHAEHWQKRQRSAEDRAFDELISLVTDPCEMCFEMIHMVQYAKQGVHPTVFESWNPPHLYAEFWILKQAQLENVPVKPQEERIVKSPIHQQHQSIQVDLIAPVISDSAPAPIHEDTSIEKSPAVRRPHRGIPGFRSILQCGANTLCGDTVFMGATTGASTTMTPTTARINRLFQDSTTGYTQCHITDSPSTTEIATTRLNLMENTPTAERIRRMFEEITTANLKQGPAEVAETLSNFMSTRPDDVENEPPQQVQRQDKAGSLRDSGLILDGKVASATHHSLRKSTQELEKSRDVSDVSMEIPLLSHR
ncbi:unnamed protein product [Echinostoma caproni]|uniref:Uncharacterized protein n=1 Tax=Echinostoma caproni TaxID=27848 RepID=A0A183AX43_9TREM|nr:unnamed protein product [Echinostoma caproni]